MYRIFTKLGCALCFKIVFHVFFISVLPVIDCGHCLIGGQRVAEFQVKNEGGSGRFCIMPRESWPTSNFKVKKTSHCYEIGHKETFAVVSPSELFTIIVSRKIVKLFVFV